MSNRHRHARSCDYPDVYYHDASRNGGNWYENEGNQVPSSSQSSYYSKGEQEGFSDPYYTLGHQPNPFEIGYADRQPDGLRYPEVRSKRAPHLHSHSEASSSQQQQNRQSSLLEPGASRAQDDDRSVTPPPTPEPSPEYLALAEQPSLSITDPSSSRKLLILDLNGTLLHRSPHSVRPKRAPGHTHSYTVREADMTRGRVADRYGAGGADGAYSDEHAGPRLRSVHPRPYMPAFRAYLFAPSTRPWLDVMVWSSAQPHSVADMVDHCFGERKTELRAVWARDTLGLSKDNYKRKVQTLKDLAKPWSQLPSLLNVSHYALHPLSPPSPHASEASTPRSSPVPLSSSPAAPFAPSDTLTSMANSASDDTMSGLVPQAHSALTTLLLDDSPGKAALQPYNHVCIGEYSATLRARDLESLQKVREWKEVAATREELLAGSAVTVKLADDETTMHTASGVHEQGQVKQDKTEAEVVNNKRKRKTRRAEREMQLDEVASVRDSSSSSSSSSHASYSTDPSSPPEDVCSPERLTTTPQKRHRKSKRQKKLEALLQSQEERTPPPDEVYDETLLAVVGILEEIKSQSNVAGWVRGGGLWGPGGSSMRKADGCKDEAATGCSPSAEEAEEAQASSNADDSHSSIKKAPPGQAEDAADRPRQKRKRRRRHRAVPTGKTVDCVSEPEEKAGNDEVTVQAPRSSPLFHEEGDSNSQPLDAPDDVENEAMPLWFEHSETLAYWAARGRKVLEELRIPVEHGIER